MNQQRSRRFRSQQEAKETREAEAKLRAEMEAKGMALPPPKPPSWDHNVITPGTPFMADLTAFLRKLVAERVAQHPAWQQLAVVLSDASVPGEGEHKLIEHVRTSQGQPGYDPNCRYVIVGKFNSEPRVKQERDSSVPLAETNSSVDNQRPLTSGGRQSSRVAETRE